MTTNETTIDDMDVFDSTRALLDDDVDLDDRAAVERALLNPYRGDPVIRQRFVNWCIKTAKANKAAGGLQEHQFGAGGFVPPKMASYRSSHDG